MKKSSPPDYLASHRRAAEAAIEKLVSEHASEHAALLKATRKALRKRLPTAHEIVYEYRDALVISISPDERGYAGVFAIRGDAEGVKLYFNFGKSLPDPDGLLRGSGGQARWVRIESQATLRKPALKTLMEAAIANHRVPFDDEGRGAIVVRETSAARRKHKPASVSKTNRNPEGNKKKSG